MTYEELLKLPFRQKLHLNMKNCHISVYESSDPRISMTVRTPVSKYGEFGESTRELCINGEPVADDKESITKAIEKL